MIRINQNRLSVGLMVSSLVLLSVFLFFWLNKVYDEAHEALENQTNFLFFNSIRDIEGELMQELFPIVLQRKDSMQSSAFKVTIASNVDPALGFRQEKRMKIRSAERDTSKKITSSFINSTEADSLKIVIFDEREKMPGHEATSTGQVGLRSRMETGGKEAMFGSLSLFQALKKEENGGDSLPPSQLDSNLTRLLDERFQKALTKAALPLSLEVVQVNDSTMGNRILLSNNYTDLVSNKSYAVASPTFRAYLFKKIAPQILFSILLFSCIGLAFFLIFQSLQQQRKLTLLKNDFISNVTHELKTPITTVGVAIEALSNFNALQNPERTKDYLNISKHELNRLSILVDKVLKMSLFEKAEPELKIEKFDLKELIQEILNSMKLQFEKFAAQVSFQSKGSPFFIEGDRAHLTSVIYNLIDNALKYSPNEPNIQIGLENSDHQLKMMISDSGIGIAQEYKEKIFEKFFRIPTGNEHNIKGYGLGLSYVAGVINKHKGNIKVESQLGKGTQFIICFPKNYE